MVLGVRCDVDIFKLTASGHSIYKEVCGMTTNYIHWYMNIMNFVIDQKFDLTPFLLNQNLL